MTRPTGRSSPSAGTPPGASSAPSPASQPPAPPRLLPSPRAVHPRRRSRERRADAGAAGDRGTRRSGARRTAAGGGVPAATSDLTTEEANLVRKVWSSSFVPVWVGELVTIRNEPSHDLAMG
ncbi:hypothetical protein U9M48_031363 [Paspalum notatum var. saurae]|uniref:Uncharacterized protein n=1 Tax=Paspalum notatum var. saurae TaxID=547442 RepID=A0AAQ3U782_PASNO